MQRYALIIQYKGDGFAGSQKQTKYSVEPTIQGEIEKALSTLTKTNIRTIFSGRTDRGVSAFEQWLHFESDYDCSGYKFINSMNGLLPKNISVKGVQKVDKTFHAQKSARARWYRYTIVNRSQRSCFDDGCLLVRNELDVDRLNEMLQYLIGEHDFSAFKKVRTTNPAKVCIIYKAQAVRDGEKIYIDLIANRFLYNMVRLIIGTLLKLEKESLAPEALKEILESKDNQQAGTMVSPEGLVLMKVIYNEINDMETAYENLFG